MLFIKIVHIVFIIKYNRLLLSISSAIIYALIVAILIIFVL